MKKLLTIFIIFLCSTVFAQNQADMNSNANESYKIVDKELNEIYKNILSEYKTDTVFIKNLIISEQIWIMFREAELKVKYPEREQGYYGSVYPMCISIYLENLTRERIKTLKIWIDGIEEGDVCAGSVKIKK